MSGPDGQGLGSNTLSLLMPFVLFSYGFGAIVDRQDNRKLLLITSIIRGLMVLSIPTILTSFGATGFIIPSSIFALSASTVLCSILDFAMVPRLAKSNQLRSANALLFFTTTIATLAAVSVAPFLFDIWLPHETLRLAAIFYFVALFFFWTLDRAKTQNAPRSANDTEELAAAFKMRKGSIALFRLGFLASVPHGIFYCLFLVFCIQNTQLNNAQASKIFATISFGFIAGAVATLTFLKQWKGSALLGYCTALAAIACLSFAALGSNTTALRIFLIAIGTAGATALVTTNTIVQKEFNKNVRGKVYGAILSLTAAIYTLTAVAVEQVTIQYSAFTIIRVIAAAWLGYVVLVCFTSAGLKTRWRRLRRKHDSKLSSKTA